MIATILTTPMGQALATFVVAMLPVLELRAALPMAMAMGVPTMQAYLLSVAGNMIPVPFIIFFIRKIFHWMRTQSATLERLVLRLEEKAHKKAEILYKYELIGLIFLVAIPLPGTGAWTGALVAALLEIRLKVAIPCIFIGVLLAGILVCLTVLGVVHISG